MGLLHDEASVEQTTNAIAEMYDFERTFIASPFFIVVLRYLT
ncbi:hypothetical protein GARC_4570 [Paraglaciecola arctica BSs20135]|uniref:Uncharacterized protein n=1 Tax=Paraglaciecola arctica BSs20135 TaxID=493475 RepID=K6YTM0_9ALTE|nr:hypothetical protein GARC_4570 [Paraglaciecola arctica BSs20135]